jgi:putative ABC transport system permease protein
MEQFLNDLRYGMRGLLRTPGFTLVAILTLALGTGANSAVFSIINAVLLRPLPYNQPDRLVMLWGARPADQRMREPTSVLDLLDYRAQASSMDGIACLSYDDFNLSTGGEPTHVPGSIVSANFFSVLGATPQLGRFFLDGEDRAGANRVAVISDRLWNRRFAAETTVIGQQVQLNGGTFEIIGVAPARFISPEKNDEIWVSISFDGADALRVPSASSAEGLTDRRLRFLKCIGRLGNGSSLQQAQEEMTVISGRLEQQYAATNAGFGANLIPLRTEIVGEIGPRFLLLSLAVGLVLWIACTNVANLLLARSTARQREIAIRAAVGASRGRLLRQLLTESFLLAFIGGIAGLVLAFGGVKLLTALNPANIQRLSQASIDLKVLGFTLAVSVITGLVFGLVPAVHASKTDLSGALKEGARGPAQAYRGRLRSALVVLEVALTQLLLVAAALTLKSFYGLQQTDPGFSPAGVLTMQIALPAVKYSEDAKMTSFVEESLRRIQAIPGVQSAAVVTPLPLQSDTAMSFRFTIDGRPPASPNERLTASYRSISPDFFRAMGIPLAKGRFFSERDRDSAPPVVIINESMKRLYWPDEEAVGKRLSLTREGGVSREIVGVVADIKQSGLRSDAGAEMYHPFLQAPWPFMALAVRGSIEPSQLSGPVRGAILEVDLEQPVFDVKPMTQVVSESINEPRLITVLLAIFAAMAIILAAAGIYGVMSYLVDQRRQEIGVRMALGAAKRDILKMVAGRSMVMAGLGFVIGTAAWLAAPALFRAINNNAGSLKTGWFAALLQLIESLEILQPFRAADLVVFAVITPLLLVIAMLATLVPARRAAQVDPVVALRAE